MGKDLGLEDEFLSELPSFPEPSAFFDGSTKVVLATLDTRYELTSHGLRAFLLGGSETHVTNKDIDTMKRAVLRSRNREMFKFYQRHIGQTRYSQYYKES